MFNPYVSSPAQRLLKKKSGGFLGGLLSKLGRLDSDDLLILLLIYLLSKKDGEEGDLWPLAAVAIYLMLAS